MTKTIRITALAALALLLSGCGSLGLPDAESFNDRVAYALATHTAVLKATTTAVSLGEISSAEAEKIAGIADGARELIDTARRIESTGDIGGADRQLSLAITVLTELQVYLRRRST